MLPLSSVDLLSQTAFFAELSPQQKQLVSRLCRLVEYPQDSQIYSLGERADDFYVLIDGMVRFSIGLGNRQTSAGEVIRRGEVFGWAALIEHAQSRIATAACLTQCSVLAINGNQLLELMENDHSLGYRILKQLNFLVTGKLTAFAAG
jgi:CRP-like cAMP-binding protein